MSTLRCCRLPIMFSLILGKHPSTAPHDGTDLGEGGAEFAPTLSAGASDDGGRDFEPRLETGLRDRVAGISECNAGRISVLVLRPCRSPTGGWCATCMKAHVPHDPEGLLSATAQERPNLRMYCNGHGSFMPII